MSQGLESAAADPAELGGCEPRRRPEQLPPGALVAMLTVLVLVNANDQVFKELSRSEGEGDFPYQVSSVVLIASFVSILGGLAACCAVHGIRSGLQRCLELQQLRLCCVPSVLFTYATVLRFVALRFLGAGVLNVTEPVFGLGLSVVATQILKGSAFRLRQVSALLFALLGLSWFLALNGLDRAGAPLALTLVLAPGAGETDVAGAVPLGWSEESKLACANCPSPRRFNRHVALGWLCMLGSATLGTTAGLAAERLLKQGGQAGQVSFLVRKTQLEVPAFFAALMSSLVLEPMLDAGTSDVSPYGIAVPLSRLLRGWDRRTLLVLGTVLARSWLAAGIVKYLDTLRYSLAQVCGMLLTFFELEAFNSQGDLVGNFRRRPGAYSAVLLVAASIGVFARASASPRTPRGAPRPPLQRAAAPRRRRTKEPPPAPRWSAWRLRQDSASELAQPLLVRDPMRRESASEFALPLRNSWGSSDSPCHGGWPSDSSRTPARQTWFGPWQRRGPLGLCSERARRWSSAAVIIVIYILADMGKMLLVGWANHGRAQSEHFSPSSLLLVQLGISVVLALGVSGAKLGAQGVLLGLRPRSVARCVPVAALFFVSKTCTVAALSHVDAGTVKLSTQLILPCTAFLSTWMIPSCWYSREQWVAIFTVCLATLAFHAVQIEAEGAAAVSQEEFERAREARIVGLSLCGIVVLANSVGSVAGERFLKAARQQVPLASLKAQLVLAELVVVVFVLAAQEAPGRRGLFSGWDWRVMVCALGWVPATWMSTIITANFGTVVKNVVQCISTLSTYFISCLDIESDNRPPRSAPATLLAFVVILSVFTFTLQSYTPAQRSAGDPPRFSRMITPSEESEEMCDSLASPARRGTTEDATRTKSSRPVAESFDRANTD